MNLGTMLDATVDRVPHKEALVYGDKRYSFTELRDEALKAATVLQNHGVGFGDTIGIMTFNSPGFVFASLGAWYIGATVVPVNHKFQAPEVEYTIKHSGTVLGIVSAELASVARAGAPHITWLETESSSSDSFDSLQRAAEPATPQEFTDEAIAQVLYTSGTTSAPKGCVHTHRNISQVATLITLNFAYTEEDRFLIAMPIWHSAPLNICLMPMLFAGGTTVLQREYHPIKTMQLVGEERITSFFGPTVAYVALRN